MDEDRAHVDLTRVPDRTPVRPLLTVGHGRTGAEELAGLLTAVMCSESVWWRCHRRLVADVTVVGRGVPVLHLMPGGALRPHPPAAGARALPDGTLVWDGA